MSRKAHGQLRRSQVITTYGPGALIDLPRHSAIVGGLDTWPKPGDLEEITEVRLSRKLETMTSVTAPRLYAPPPDGNDPREPARGIGAWRFPEWFVVQESGGEGNERARRLVARKALDEKGRFDGRPVVATRFVRACPKGHVDDLDWWRFVHGSNDPCRRQLWLDERGTSGDLADLVARCECGKSRGMHEATVIELTPLGICRGARPWLGRNSNEDCNQPSRLLIRTASNAYFPQLVSVLSLPDRGSAVQGAVKELWDDLQIVDGPGDLAFLKKKPKIAEKLAPFVDDEVLAAIRETKNGRGAEKPVKQVEIEALLAAPEGFGDDVPVDPTSMLDACLSTSGDGPPEARGSPRFCSFIACAKWSRWWDSLGSKRCRQMSTASTSLTSSAPSSLRSRSGFRRLRTVARACSFSCEPMRFSPGSLGRL